MVGKDAVEQRNEGNAMKDTASFNCITLFTVRCMAELVGCACSAFSNLGCS